MFDYISNNNQKKNPIKNVFYPQKAAFPVVAF